MPSKGTTSRNIRIADELWQTAVAVAAQRGESVSEVIRRALVEYVAVTPHAPDHDEPAAS